MQLDSIFLKPVDRPIEGVIKADDKESLQTEIEEYILTNEVEKRLERFLSVYNNYQGANGVWISGFFGSGKSHLLKMVSYLLDGTYPDADFIVNSFLDKCRDNKILQGEIKKAVSSPAQSILFNIDQKADVINKTEVDALLGVFVKVFNEMQGYYGKHGYIAQFERDLDREGIYHDFKEAYEQITRRPWYMGREQSIFEGGNISQAYAQVTGNHAEKILDKYRNEYSVSIEDFAKMVNDYIQRQGPGFRLNFFVDEVGQYIADNVKLMTNLQTVAESLATTCKGRAWIIVTAQENMDSVVGDMTAQQGNDFSKIQARFDTRMKLTSQDVAEVIQKRLLAKNDPGVRATSNIYQQQVNSFKTLFDFTEGQTYRNYRDEEHFINSYPFIPYQFVLFQSAIQSLSQHNAFEGRHSSVGERSMLGVFQEVALQIRGHDIGQLATFDLMYEGISSSLKRSAHSSIIVAQDHLDNKFAIRLLKALFLVKYVKEFKATIHNLSVLMTERFGQDIDKLRKQVEEALNILEQQTYIQRNGQVYEYLTDEEKDVEQEIKNTEIDSYSTIEELGKIVFDRIIKESKFRPEDGQQYYPFMRKLDGQQFKGKYSELAIHLITPFNEHVSNLEILVSQSMGTDELFVIMPADDRIVRDLRLYMQTSKYFQQSIASEQNERIKMILSNKQFQNQERHAEIIRQANELIADATFIVNGEVLEVPGKDPQSSVIRGFQHLIRKTYYQLNMLPSIHFKDTDVGQYLNKQDGLFGNDAIELSEAENEMFNYIQLQKNNGIRVTFKTLIDRFENKPYGWYLAAVQCILAKLYARRRVEIQRDSNLLEGKELEDAIVNTRYHSNLVVVPEETFTARQIKALKDFYNEFFDAPPGSEDARDLGRKTKESLQEAIRDLTTLTRESHKYPFLRQLDPVIEKLREVAGKPYAWYLTEFDDAAGGLLDMKDNFISPIRSFMNGGQRNIYDAAAKFINDEQANIQSIGDSGYDDALKIKDILQDHNCFRGSQMQEVREIAQSLEERIGTALDSAKELAFATLDQLYDGLKADERFKQLDNMQQMNIEESFKDIGGRLDEFTVISVVNQEIQRFNDQTFTRILTQIDEWLKPTPTGGGAVPPEYIQRSKINVNFGKIALENETDVDAYLNQLKEAYLEQIRAGKRIRL